MDKRFQYKEIYVFLCSVINLANEKSGIMTPTMYIRDSTAEKKSHEGFYYCKEIEVELLTKPFSA